MKILYPNSVTAAVSSASDENYPAANVLDYHPKKTWKSGVTTAVTLTLTISTGASVDGFIIYNTNIAGIWALKDAGGTTIESGTLTPDTAYDMPRTWVVLAQRRTNGVSLVLSCSSGVQNYAGIVQAGIITEYRNPKYGFSVGYKDFSIKKEMNNGATYIKQRDRIYSFSGTYQDDYSTSNGLSPLFQLIKSIEPHPVPVQVISGGLVMSTFGRMETDVKATLDNIRHASLSLNIIEII